MSCNNPVTYIIYNILYDGWEIIYVSIYYPQKGWLRYVQENYLHSNVGSIDS